MSRKVKTIFCYNNCLDLSLFEQFFLVQFEFFQGTEGPWKVNLKKITNSWPSASNLQNWFFLLIHILAHQYPVKIQIKPEKIVLTVCQNNYSNKIPFLKKKKKTIKNRNFRIRENMWWARTLLRRQNSTSATVPASFLFQERFQISPKIQSFQDQFRNQWNGCLPRVTRLGWLYLVRRD